MTIAKINKEMMYWAREYAGFINGYEDLLPENIKGKYELWENGEKYPTWNQLRSVSKKFHVPTAFFFMKKPPKVENIPKLINYRKLDLNNKNNSMSPYLLENIRKSESNRSTYIELLNAMGEEINPFEKCDKKLDKEIFSDFIRNKIDVSVDTQKTWLKKNKSKDTKHYNFLNMWKEKISEKFGVLVFETKNVDISEMRGLCIFHEKIPIILLNGKDLPNGRIFSLFHELTHLLLGESAICGDDLDKKEEIFCNSVAGEFLVPNEDLLNNLITDEFDDKYLNELSNIYGVSKQVIIRRLYDLGELNEEKFNLKNEKYEGSIISNSKSDGGGNFYNNMIKYYGKPYYSLVVSAYDSGVIDTVKLTKCTGLKKSHLPKVCNLLFGGEQ